MTDEPPKDLESAVKYIKEERAKRAKTAKVKGPLAPWLADCQASDKGHVYANLRNALIGLRQDLSLRDRLAFDEMRREAVVKLSLPVTPDGAPGAEPPHPVKDTDASMVQEWLQYRGLPLISRDTIHQAIDLVAEAHAFHPVSDWLDSLVWDQQPRVAAWLATYLGATNGGPEYLAKVGQIWLVSMVARIYWPGCKADYMVVLEGDQGVLKSTACRTLAGERWFGDCLPDIHSKDAKQYLRGLWLIEVSELSAFTKADIETLKAFLSRQHEEYRPPYGRRKILEPRQCVFVGTTNRAVYVKDETGARRILPVKVGKILINAIERDREQLFAEAVHIYRTTNLGWWPDPEFEAKWIKPQQQPRMEVDPWEQAIEEHLEAFVGNRITILEIAKNALHFDSEARIKVGDSMRIASILQNLGWIADRDHSGRFYRRPPVTP